MGQRTLLVLAGGFGTRLRAAVADVPKPLAPVFGQPYLHYLLETWLHQGIHRLIFSLHYQAELIQAFLASHPISRNITVETLTESQPLGTGGAIALAVKEFRLKEPFIVSNADTWLGTGIEEISAFTAPAIGIVQVNNVARYGCVEIRNDRIVKFLEKEKSKQAAGWINAGLYWLQPSLFENWNGMPFSLERDLFPKLVESSQLRALPLNTDFIDIGIPEDYARFCRWIESGRKERL